MTSGTPSNEGNNSGRSKFSRHERLRRRNIARDNDIDMWTGPSPDPSELLRQFVALAVDRLDRYEGADLTLDVVKETLRTALLESIRARELHTNQLSAIDRFASNSPGQKAIQEFIASQLRLAKIERVTDTSDPALFTVVEGQGDVLTLLQPAYVDQTSGRLVLIGQARRMPNKKKVIDDQEMGE
jgi:hypothetical protein